MNYDLGRSVEGGSFRCNSLMLANYALELLTSSPMCRHSGSHPVPGVAEILRLVSSPFVGAVISHGSLHLARQALLERRGMPENVGAKTYLPIGQGVWEVKNGGKRWVKRCVRRALSVVVAVSEISQQDGNCFHSETLGVQSLAGNIPVGRCISHALERPCALSSLA